MPDISGTIVKLRDREERLVKRIEKLKGDVKTNQERLRAVRKDLRAAEREAKKK